MFAKFLNISDSELHKLEADPFGAVLCKFKCSNYSVLRMWRVFVTQKNVFVFHPSWHLSLILRDYKEKHWTYLPVTYIC